MNAYPTQEEISALLDYDPDTGALTWKTNTGSPVKPGSSTGRRQVMIHKRKLAPARAIWILVYGVPTEGKYVDHINGDEFDNRLVNLRLATFRQNMANRLYKGTTGIVGVKRVRGSSTWWVRYGGKYRGAFASSEEAELVRWCYEDRFDGAFGVTSSRGLR